MASFIAFDLEGPLSPQDNAYELMKLFPGGDRGFEVISRYDDLLALDGREGYEPGDTLALIFPFLAAHGITENDIANLAVKATFTGGAPDLVHRLLSASWRVFCITTSYEPYALHLTHKLGIYSHNVAATPFPLGQVRDGLLPEDLALLQQAERDILALGTTDDDAIKRTLDDFFWKKLPGSGLGALMQQVKAVGGRRKVAALNRFAEKHDNALSRWVAVGDSITDCRMLEAVDRVGGLAIAFNSNEYALPCATMGLASTSISDLIDVLLAWPKGRREVERLVRAKEKAGGSGDRGHFQWLAGRHDLEPIIQLHKRIRRLVREDAGKLG